MPWSRGRCTCGQERRWTGRSGWTGPYTSSAAPASRSIYAHVFGLRVCLLVYTRFLSRFTCIHTVYAYICLYIYGLCVYLRVHIRFMRIFTVYADVASVVKNGAGPAGRDGRARIHPAPLPPQGRFTRIHAVYSYIYSYIHGLHLYLHFQGWTGPYTFSAAPASRSIYAHIYVFRAYLRVFIRFTRVLHL